MAFTIGRDEYKQLTDAAQSHCREVATERDLLNVAVLFTNCLPKMPMVLPKSGRLHRTISGFMIMLRTVECW